MSSNRSLSLFGLAATGLMFSAHATAQVTSYGEWYDSGVTSLELYVDHSGFGPGGVPAFKSITDALASLPTPLTVPTTINVLPGSYDVANGETFPLMLPTHGLTIEPYGGGWADSVVDTTGANALEAFLYNSQGNQALPDSVLRGLGILHFSSLSGSAVVRVDVPSPAMGEEEVAVEIRDCVIAGESTYGVDIVGQRGIRQVTVIERNLVTPISTYGGSGIAGIHIQGSDSPMSPVVRSNDINYFLTNVLIERGGLNNQPRIQSNFIQRGEINVDVADAAPFLINNTIAYATATSGAIGLRLTSAVGAGLFNNMIWNPEIEQYSYNPADVVADAATLTSLNDVNLAAPVLLNEFLRTALNNIDEDDFLYNQVELVSGMPNFGPSHPLNPLTPGFVGGDVWPGGDLHLAASSPARSQGLIDVAVFIPNALNFISAEVGYPGNTMFVRLDHGHDFDFGARVTGRGLDIGADQCILLEPGAPTSYLREATLAANTGTGNDIDYYNNVYPDASGDWASEVVVDGIAGDIMLVIFGTGFRDTVADPIGLSPTPFENTSLFENELFSNIAFPGVVTPTSISAGLDSTYMVLVTGGVHAGTPVAVPFNFGPATAALWEAEVQVQGVALTFDGSGNKIVQSTNRMTLELNL